MNEQRLGDWADWPFEPRDIVRALERHEVRYVIVGGFAAIVHGAPLPTYDVDITPERSRKNAGALFAALADLDALALPEGADEIAPHVLLESVTDLSFFTPSGYLDVVFAPAGTSGYRELAARATRIEIADGMAPLIADLRDVVLSMQVLRRTRDVGHLPALRTLLELQLD